MMFQKINCLLFKYPALLVALNTSILVLLKLIFIENLFAEELTTEEQQPKSRVKEMLILVGIILVIACIVGAIKITCFSNNIPLEEIVVEEMTDPYKIAFTTKVSVGAAQALLEKYPDVVGPLIEVISKETPINP